MSWREIRTLFDDGFEIGNHTGNHMGVNAKNTARLEEQLAYIDQKCEAMGIPKPISFAWPGNFIALEGLPVLKKHGIVFGRRGGAPEYTTDTGQGFAFEPGRDDPLLIPSAGVPRPGWRLETFADAVGQARNGRIAVIQFHGVPEIEHPWVHTSRELFEQYMQYLKDHGYRVIAMRDLARHIDPAVSAAEPMAIIDQRKKMLSQPRQ
jgi:peptidoglycan/xylan/chitin deacetylase (PgdA/CDA1 family)